MNFPYEFAVFYYFSKNTTNAAEEHSESKDRQNMTFLFWRDESINDIFIYLFIFHLFREGCPSTEVVFQGAFQLKTNYNIQLECQKIRTHNIKNLFTTI